MPDTYVALPDGTYVHVPSDATPDQLTQLRTKLSSFASPPTALGIPGKLAGYDPGQVTAGRPQPVHQAYLDKWLPDTDSAPAKTYQAMINADPSEWNQMLRGYSSVGRDALTFAARTYKEKPTTMRAANAGDRGIPVPEKALVYDPSDPLGYASAVAGREIQSDDPLTQAKGFARSVAAGTLDPRMLALTLATGGFGPAVRAAGGAVPLLGKAAVPAAARMVTAGTRAQAMTLAGFTGLGAKATYDLAKEGKYGAAVPAGLMTAIGGLATKSALKSLKSQQATADAVAPELTVSAAADPISVFMRQQAEVAAAKKGKKSGTTGVRTAGTTQGTVAGPADTGTTPGEGTTPIVPEPVQTVAQTLAGATAKTGKGERAGTTPAPTVVDTTVPEAPTAAKEPWEMTQKEFVAISTRPPSADYQTAARVLGIKPTQWTVAQAADHHEGFVRNAVRQGKPVPPEVLADYPNLVEPQAPTPAVLPVVETPTGPKQAKPTIAELAARHVQQIRDAAASHVEDVFAGVKRKKGVTRAQHLEEIADSLETEGFTVDDLREAIDEYVSHMADRSGQLLDEHAETAADLKSAIFDSIQELEHEQFGGNVPLAGRGAKPSTAPPAPTKTPTGVKGRRAGATISPDEWIKAIAERVKAAELYGPAGLIKPTDLPESTRRTLDKARDNFVQKASYTNRIAPDAVREAVAYDQSPKLADALTNKIDLSLKPLGSEANKDLFHQMIIADRQIERGQAPGFGFDEAKVRDFFNLPAVQQVLPAYKAAVSAVYDPMRALGGYTAESLGKYSGAWTPAVSIEHIKGAYGGRAPSGKPTMVMSKMPGEDQFTGTSDYLPSLAESHRFRLGGLANAVGQRRTISALLMNDVARPVPKDFDGTMDINGKSVPAMRVPLAARFGFKVATLKRFGIPNEVIMPVRTFDDIRAPFERSVLPYDPAEQSKGMAAMMKAFLYSTAELGAHAVTLPSIASTKVGVKTGIPRLDTILDATPLKIAARMKDMLGGTKFTDEEVADGRIYAAKAGVARDNPLVGKTGKELAKTIAAAPGTAALYANRGLFNNIVTGMVKTMKGNGATDAQIIDTLSALPSRKGSFVPGFQKIVESVAGPGFYSTGKAALQAGYGSMTPKNIMGALAFYSLAGKAADDDHKWWWERGLMPGQFVRGHDTNGKGMMWDLASLDRMMRVQREIPGRTFQEAQVNLPGETPWEKAKRVGETAGISAFNQAIRPAVSGPTAAIGSTALGVAPYLVKSKDKTSWEPIHPGTAALPYDDPERLLALLESVVPGSQMMLGDVSADYRANAPEDPRLVKINRLLRAFGQTPGKTYDEDQKLISAILTEYGNKSGTIKGRKRAAMEAQAKARARQ